MLDRSYRELNCGSLATVSMTGTMPSDQQTWFLSPYSPGPRMGFYIQYRVRWGHHRSVALKWNLDFSGVAIGFLWSNSYQKAWFHFCQGHFWPSQYMNSSIVSFYYLYIFSIPQPWVFHCHSSPLWNRLPGDIKLATVADKKNPNPNGHETQPPQS